MEITLELTKKQSIAYKALSDDKVFEVGYGGSAGGGKTYLGVAWQIIRRLQYPETTGLLGRKELKNLKRTTLATFFKVCEDWGLKDGIHYTYNQQDGIIHFPNQKSKIYLMDMSYSPQDPNYTRFGGLELTDAFVDESNECPEQSITILKTRIGRGNNDKYGLKPKILETFNPDKGHVYRRYYKPYKDNSLNEKTIFIPAVATDNPHLPESYIENLRNSDTITRERLLYGNFDYDDDPTMMIPHENAADLFTNHLTQTGTEKKYLIVDVARFGKDTSVIAYMKGGEWLQAHTYESNSTVFLVDEIKRYEREYQVPRSCVHIDDGGVGGGVVDMLPGCKPFVSNAIPIAPNDNALRNYQNLKTQCAYHLANKSNEHSLSIKWDNPKLKERLLEEIAQLKTKDQDKDGKLKIKPKDEMKADLGRSPDLLDVMIMWMKPLMQETVSLFKINVFTQGKSRNKLDPL